MLWNSQVSCSLSEFINIWSSERIDMILKNLRRIFLSNFFDRHSSSWRVNEARHTGSPIKCYTQVHFLINIDFLHKVHTIDRQSILTRLFGDQVISNEFGRNLLSLLWCADKFDSSLETCFFNMAHASASSENLRFNDTSSFEFRSNLLSFIWSECHFTNWNCNSV